MTWRAKVVVAYGSWHCLVIAVYSIVLRATCYVAIVTDRQSHKILLVCMSCIHTNPSDDPKRISKDCNDLGIQPSAFCVYMFLKLGMFSTHIDITRANVYLQMT